MRKLFAITLSLCVLFSAFAQDKKPVLTVANEQVSVDEFQRIYRKNNNETPEGDLEAIKSYMELFVNFKLKVKEAEALGYDTAQAFIRELAGYRKQLAQPYFTDNEVTESLVAEAYQRMKSEVKASHLLLRLDPDALPEDTQKVYKRILEIRKEIVGGLPFDEAAKRYSEDPSAKMNAGDLGYFTAFQMVFPFEEAAYKTPVGEVSKPVRTRFGYHLVKVVDKRNSRGEVRTAHILVKSRTEDDSTKQAQAKAKINEIYASLQKGDDFAELASTYSDDFSSSKKGGELPWFGSNRMVLEFEEAAFGLQDVGDFSKPFKTDYGWHIVTLLEKRGIDSFDKMKKEIERKVERDGRGAKSKEVFMQKLKAMYQFKLDEKAVQEVVKAFDDSYYQKEWKAEKVKGNKTIFSMEDTKYIPEKLVFTQQDFAKAIEGSSRFRVQRPGTTNEFVVRAILDEVVERQIINFEDSRLETKYPDFAALMKEYRDGILLFELMDDMVWSKAATDTIGLQAFYEKHKEEYLWPQRVKAEIYTAQDLKLAKKAQKIVKKGAKGPSNFNAVLSKFNQESQLNLTADSGLFEVDVVEAFTKIPLEAGVSAVYMLNNDFVFARVYNILPPQPKSLNEARGTITAAYQNYLEKEWIASLRSKYAFNVHEENLKFVK